MACFGNNSESSLILQFNSKNPKHPVKCKYSRFSKINTQKETHFFV